MDFKLISVINKVYLTRYYHGDKPPPLTSAARYPGVARYVPLFKQQRNWLRSYIIINHPEEIG
jgi:hypothetical protein